MARRRTEEWFWQVSPDLTRIGELSQQRPSVANGRFWEPRADVTNLPDKIVIRVEIAGIRSEDVGLLYNPERNTILIRGVRLDQTSSDRNTAFLQLEIPYGEFAREIHLPAVPIKAQMIRAQYRNGFLTVEIPKAERVAVRTTIVIENI
jgi:HSP20 family protein